MSSLSGRTLLLSQPQRVQADLARFAMSTPTSTLERSMALAPLAAIRNAADPQPSWLAIFLKAFALVASRSSELRRVYVGFPWARLYEHPVNITAVEVEQHHGDALVSCLHTIACPDEHSLLELDAEVERA